MPVDTVHVEDDHPYRAIQETVQARGCDAIVMASYGRNARRTRDPSEHPLDSETVRVLSHANVPVVVYP